MELKEGYKRKIDNYTKVTHIYPEKGRAHTFDNCWCDPIISIGGSVCRHRESKQNPTYCKGK